LGLLVVSANDETTATRPGTQRSRNALIKASSEGKGSDSKNGYPITFYHLGRHQYHIVLWASTWVARKKWIENIQKQQERIREQTLIFEEHSLSEGFFTGINKVNCAAPFSELEDSILIRPVVANVSPKDNGRRLAFGTSDGVYFSDLREPNREPVKVVGLTSVEQLDILDEYQLLIVLSGASLLEYC